MDHLIKDTLDSGFVGSRIILRKLTPDDADNMFAYTSDAETCRYLGWGPHTDREQCVAFIDAAIVRYQQPKDILWGIALSEDDVLIGVIRIYELTESSTTVSYILNRAYTGSGYMTEALCAIIDVCFRQLDKDAVIAYFVNENQASQRVMERCGMRACDEYQQTENIKGKAYQLRKYKIGRDCK